MPNLNELLTFKVESAYDLPMKKNYSNPKLYTANGDLKKRWYVYYRFRNPKTDILQKMLPIYLGVNNYKTKEE